MGHREALVKIRPVPQSAVAQYAKLAVQQYERPSSGGIVGPLAFRYFSGPAIPARRGTVLLRDRLNTAWYTLAWRN